jgi:hypothetical protein
MAQTAPFRDRALSNALSTEGVSLPRGAWARLKLITSRSFFWSYERGSWQYDIICAVILVFIFLTPASWFHDRPTLGLTNLRHTQGVIEVGSAPDGWHYLIDARLVSSLAPLNPNDAIGQILERRLHRPVRLKAVGILRDRNHVVLGYTVVLSR